MKKPIEWKDILALYRAIGQPMNEVPQELIRNAKATRTTIVFLQGFAKIQEGKYVSSMRGLKNKFKHHFLGYPFVAPAKQE